MTWDGIVTKAHKHHVKAIGIDQRIESYMQSAVIKKTLESISLDYRRGEDMIEEGLEKDETLKIAPKGLEAAADKGKESLLLE